MTIGKKIVLLSVGIPLVFGVVIAATLGACRTPVERALAQGTQVAVDGVSDALSKSAEAIAKDIYRACEIRHTAATRELSANLRVGKKLVADGGGVALGEQTVAWDMQNQLTGEHASKTLPQMLLGGKWLGRSTSFADHAPICDTLTELLGCTATVFQRANEAGDMLRVSTSARKADGTRAVGTYLPATNPSDEPNPVVASLLRGETYRGRAFVVDAWQLTAYEPLRDDQGKLIGALFVGFSLDTATESLREGLKRTIVGESGYVFALGASKEERGKYLVSKGGSRDGENIWEAVDPDGNKPVQDIINGAVANTGNGGVELYEYLWKNEADPRPRRRICAYT